MVILRSNGVTALVKVTRKGQATIPKKLREKFGIGDVVMVSGTEEGILIKPAPRPVDEFGSLKKLFRGKTSREILAEARMEDAKREKQLLEHVQR